MDVNKNEEDISPPEESSNTFLIPRDAFGGDCEVGDIYKIKVVSKLEDELEVKPAGHDKKEKNNSEDDDMENPVDAMMKESEYQ